MAVTAMQRVARWVKGMLPRGRGWRVGSAGSAWPSTSFDRLQREGYRLNAAVNICVTKFAMGYQQPGYTVVDARAQLQTDHDLLTLLRRPNALMGEAELRLFIATYKAVGGQCYLHKVRDDGGQVIELWPYHAGQMRPVPGQQVWIDRYDYTPSPGDKPIAVDPADVVHLKWPAVDPEAPWLALAPLLAVAREVDTDSEATRYMYALLYNDAVPLTVIKTKAKLNDTKFNRLRDQFEVRHGGANRGRAAVLEDGAEIERLGLDLQQLAFDALRKVPEARISSAFGVPAMYAGLNVGMERAIYNNVSEARRAFFEDTIMQHAGLDDGELSQDLGPEFGGVTVGRDWSQVVALQENADAVYGRATSVWKEGLTTRNETRRMIGLPRVEDLVSAPGAPALPPGDEFRPAPQIFSITAPGLPEPAPIDVTPPTAARALPADPRLIAKALQVRSTTARERRIQRALQDYLRDQYNRAAGAVGGE